MQNRRQFLKLGTGVALGGIGAMITTGAAATNNCQPTIHWDETVDVIIIGSGFAGLSAAVNINRQKLGKVLVLEKMQVFGGNSAINGGWLAVPRNPIQLSQGINDDSPEELVKDQIKSGRGMADVPMLEQIANRSMEAYDLCIASGVKFRDGFNIQVGGHNKARAIRTQHGTGGDITTKLLKVAQDEGVETRLQQYVEDFIMENDRIIGLKVRSNYRAPDMTTGEIRYIRATKGVVLAHGGFAKNKTLRALFDPSLDPTLDCTNAAGATGEVTLTAMSHGALPVHMNMIQTGHWGSPDEGGFGWSNALLSITWHEGMSVSVLNGRRYMDERADRKTCSEAIMKNRYPDGSPAYPIAFFNYLDHPDDDRVVRALRDKMAWKVDSIEAMAKQFNIDANALKASIDEHNKHVEARHDPLFNRKMDTAQILKPPFVVSRVWPKVHYCMGGLKTDLGGRVLASRTLTPMPNLYAIGEATGGIHGETRLSSTSCLECLVMGIVVADTLTSDSQE
ncbi:flavocytochrome c [Shewanella algae]